MPGFEWEQHGPLYGLLAVPLVLLVFHKYWTWRTRSIEAIGKGSERWLVPFPAWLFWLKSGVLLLSMCLLLLALANPVWHGKSAPQKQNACDVFIALDISRSMLATDLRPNRMVQARLFAQELLTALSGNRVGLIFFAGDAFLSMPLSTDYSTTASMLAVADPSSYSAQGTAIANAVQLARKSFDPDGGGRAIVLITDGEDHEEEHEDAISTAFEQDGTVTFAVGVGTVQGATIPYGGAPLRDAENQVVTTVLNTAALEAMAEAGGSDMPPVLVSDPGSPAQKLADAVNQLQKKEIAVRNAATRHSGYQWLILPAFLLLGWLLLRLPKW